MLPDGMAHAVERLPLVEWGNKDVNYLKPCRWVLALFISLGLVPAIFAEGPATIYTRNSTLRLPIQIEEASKSEVAEVKLFVKGPAGRWECAATASPRQSMFEFQPKGDGEYLFAFVTINRQGQMYPTNLDTAETLRKVVVDTVAPEVMAHPIPSKTDRLIQCHVRDLNPDLASIRVSYRKANGSYQPLPVAASETPTVFRVTSPEVMESKIRVMAKDRAGNITTREIDLSDPTVALGAKGTPESKIDPIPVSPATRDVQPTNFREPGKSTSAKLPEMTSLPDLPTPTKTTPSSAGSDLELKLPDLPPPTASRPPIATPVARDKMDLPPPVSSVLPPSEPLKDPLVNNNPKPTTGGSDLIMPSVPTPAVERTNDSRSGHPLMNTRTVAVNYQIEGKRIPKSIDFWATPDSGRSWIQLRDQGTGNGSARLTLPADGLFGIRIRPGAGTHPPETGEEADLMVEIDTDKPVVSLPLPKLGSGDDDGVMLISWNASDKHLLSNSVNIQFATRPDGPWETIVNGYKNDGQYRWTMPPALSGNLYIRLEIADRAGNIGRADLSTPVSVEPLARRVKVLGIGPAK
jgi:hypothetical protein